MFFGVFWGGWLFPFVFVLALGVALFMGGTRGRAGEGRGLVARELVVTLLPWTSVTLFQMAAAVELAWGTTFRDGQGRHCQTVQCARVHLAWLCT